MSENNKDDLPKGLRKDTTTGEGANIFKELKDKSEDDSNSYSKINKSIISKLKLGDKKDLLPVLDKDVKILKGDK